MLSQPLGELHGDRRVPTQDALLCTEYCTRTREEGHIGLHPLVAQDRLPDPQQRLRWPAHRHLHPPPPVLPPRQSLTCHRPRRRHRS